jgi:hypothetical protein
MYDTLFRDSIVKTKHFLWIATADIKNLHIIENGRSRPFLSLLNDFAHRKIEMRLIHAKEPGPSFQNSFDTYPALISALEMMQCPRCHLKTLVIDGKWIYFGSANLTGAGMGAKSQDTRNFEIGFISNEPQHTEPVMEQFDQLWTGVHCRSCKRKTYCTQYEEMMP